MKLTGFEAIEFAEQEGLTLNKAADSVDPEAVGLTIAEAEAIATDNPERIWLVVPDEEYGVRKNLAPGSGTQDNRPRRRAGLRADELLPGETLEDNAGGGTNQSGTPGGGLAGGGLAGTNAGDGSYDAQLEDAMGAGIYDTSGDNVDEEEPEAGSAGGAAGGTPAGKRAGPRMHDPAQD